MIGRFICSFIVAVILVFLYLVANLYALVAFLLWDHRAFQKIWLGEVKSSYESGWGFNAFVRDFFESTAHPWKWGKR